jgi:predicted GTPase
MAGPTPGLTRDAVHTELAFRGRTIRLVDTAGMRRWGAWDLTTPLEGEAVGAAKRALMMANVVALVVDASAGSALGLTNQKPTLRFKSAAAVGQGGTEEGAAAGEDEGRGRGRTSAGRRSGGAGPDADAPAPRQQLQYPVPRSSSSSEAELQTAGMTRQDLSIAQQVLEEGRGLVVVVNKVDASGDPRAAVQAVREQVDGLHEGRGAEVVRLSALHGTGLSRLLPAVLTTFDAWNRRVPTTQLNKWLHLVMRHHPPPNISRTGA